MTIGERCTCKAILHRLVGLISVVALFPAVVCGCQNNFGISVSAYELYNYFNADGKVERWEYQSLDESIDWVLEITKGSIDVVEEGQIVELVHGDAGTELPLWMVRWMNDPYNGVRIYGFVDLVNGSETEFETPVQVAVGSSLPGDTIRTTTDGFTFTSRFEGIGGCETIAVPGWRDEHCAIVTISDDDDDLATNGILTGTYTLAGRYGPALLELDAYQTTWSLSDYTLVE